MKVKLKCFLWIFFFTEPFLESVPQLHVLLVILIQSLPHIDGNQPNNRRVVDTSDPFFLATFLSSILSASFGVSKLLKLGPCPLVPQDKFGLVFLMVFLSILTGLVGKGIMVAFVIGDFIEDPHQRSSCLAFLFCSSYLLPTLFVSTKS